MKRRASSVSRLRASRSAFLLRASRCAFLCFSIAGLAHAEWLTTPSRSVSIGDSASPDAPVTSYAYGPRARASLGVDLAVLKVPREGSTWRFGGMALVAFEDVDDHDPFPGETVRNAWEASAALSFEDFARGALGPGHTFEVALGFGRRSAYALDGFALDDAYQPDDVPFGAGGLYLGTDAALRSPLGARFTSFSRLALRGYASGFADAAGTSEIGNFLADASQQGAKWQASFELGLRFVAAPTLEPLARLYWEVIEPHDDSAKTLWLGRLLLGVGLPSESWEAAPFVDVEAGHGSGLAVNRSELRLGTGVRVYAR
jgi:hypothetical protein